MLIRTLLALALTALVVLGWEWVMGTEVRGWLVVLVYVLAYAVLGLPERMKAEAHTLPQALKQLKEEIDTLSNQVKNIQEHH